MKKIGISLNDNNFNDSVLNLGYFLKGFFKFYSKDFDNSCQGISIKNGGNFLNNIENGYGEIYVENVINKKENIGRNCNKYAIIKKLFEKAYLLLEESRPDCLDILFKHLYS